MPEYDGDNEKPVKIVGLNHGLCLAYALYLEGWQHERYADVIFYCKEAGRERPRANRSVLAAASPFFAGLLPDGELDNDVCITVELSHDETIRLLQYVYSGRLTCTGAERDATLSMLRDFHIALPGYGPATIVSGGEDGRPAEIEILVEDTSPSPGVSDVFPSPAAKEGLASGEAAVSFKSYSNRNRKSESARTGLLETITRRRFGTSSKAALKFQQMGSTLPQHSTLPAQATDGRGLSSATERVIDADATERDSVTLMLPPRVPAVASGARSWSSGSLEKWALEQGTVRTEGVIDDRLPLQLYVLHTWGHGIHSIRESFDKTVASTAEQVTKKVQGGKGQSLVHNWTSFRQPTFLTSRPRRVYTKGSGVKLRRSSAPSKSLSTPQPTSTSPSTNAVHNATHHKGKIHVTLNGRLHLQLPVPQLFQDGADSHEQSTETEGPAASVVEDVGDRKDLMLAKNYLQEELGRKQRLQIKLRLFSDRLRKCKEMARLALTIKREMDRRGELSGSLVLKPEIGSSGPTKKPAVQQVQCEQCGKMIQASRLALHLKTHGGIKSHVCDLCGRAFLLKAYLNAHIRINHRGMNRPKRFMCSICGYTCDQKHKLEVHERIHTDERPFECQFCDKKFREKGTLTRHIRTHTGEKPYACNICGTAYAARDTYVQHYKRKHEPRSADAPAEPPRPDRRTKNSNVVIYRCEFCQKGFYRVLAYEKHRATHTGIAAAVPCSQSDCDFTYSDMTQLKDHMAICHPGKIYTCNTCSKVFLTKQNLVNHQAKHDPNLGFRCSHCSLSLTTKASLVSHEKIHTRDRPYVCPYCGMSFHSPYLIKIHIRKHQPTPQQPVKRKRGSKREASSVTPAATGGHEIETHVEASVVVEEAIQQDQHGQVAYY